MAVAAGAKVSAVARVYRMPCSTVSNILRRSKTVVPSIAKGNNPKLDADGLKMLENFVEKNRFLPVEKLGAKFYLHSDVKLTANTLRGYLHKLGFNARTAAQKPFLSEKNVARRLVWADSHEKYTEEEWRRVIYSDESSFAVRPMKNNIRVWRKKNERFNFSCMIPTFKSGYQLVNVYGAFSATGRTKLVRIDGKFTQHVYRKILEEVTLPFAYNSYMNAENFILQEDNCGPHRAKSIEAFLSDKGVARMKWPAQSPDLNPIENVWGLMKQRLRRSPTYPKSKDHLFEILTKMWDELPQSYFEKLALGMYKRVQAVKKNDGKATKY